MADALDLLENIQQLDIKAIAIESVNDNKEVIADLNALQLSQGLRATGTKIQPPYAPLTIELKQGKPGLSGITDRVTLHDIGSHYQRLYAQAEGDEIEYGSKDYKSESLQKKYGAIYGLTEDSKDELIEQHLKETFYDKAHNATGL